ncbi:MAG: transglycosylase SLT domain-containing protein [Oligoflexia bacterium]|nr:transglycosylase SLT domain-containing protein [Oligoflexia bacterium]
MDAFAKFKKLIFTTSLTIQFGLSTTVLSILLTGCAHEQKASTTKPSQESVGWPLVPAQNNSQNNTPAPASAAATATSATTPEPEPESVPIPMSPQKKTIAQKPAPIKIPRPNHPTEPFASETPLIFDIPVAYNARVAYWIEYFQTSGRGWFTKWLERSTRYLPTLQKTLKRHGLPQDLAYMAMIESGFSATANSSANAVGPWQFIRETGKRYGLSINWWLDERRDFQKSSDAAAKYMKKMYGMFHNWYLVAAGYNTGENRIKRLMIKHETKSFWKMAKTDGALMDETKDYVPKLIAAMLIAKSPQMYGFRNINYNTPFSFEHFRVPGGTRLAHLADALGVTVKHMEELNPELVRSYVPTHVEGHTIRIPKGSYQLVSRYIRRTFVSER